MNKRRTVYMSAILVLLALIIGASLMYANNLRIDSSRTTSREISRGDTESRDIQKGELKASWIFVDMSALVRDSDIIIRGKVVTVLPSVEGPKPKPVIGQKGLEEALKRGESPPFTIVGDEKGAEEALKERRGFIYTDKIIKVEKYYKNPLPTDEIMVREHGGKIGEREEGFTGVTLLKEGDEVILFVEKFLKIKTENKYQIMGGPQGKYYIAQDQAVREDKDPKMTKKVTDFEAEIMSLVSQQ